MNTALVFTEMARLNARYHSDKRRERHNFRIFDYKGGPAEMRLARFVRREGNTLNDGIERKD
jgi:hypothetical protein